MSWTSIPSFGASELHFDGDAVDAADHVVKAAASLGIGGDVVPVRTVADGDRSLVEQVVDDEGQRPLAAMGLEFEAQRRVDIGRAVDMIVVDGAILRGDRKSTRLNSSH